MNWRYVPYRDLTPMQRVMADAFRKASPYVLEHRSRFGVKPLEVVVSYSQPAFDLLGETLLEISGSRIANLPVVLIDAQIAGAAFVPAFDIVPTMTLTVRFEVGHPSLPTYAPLPPVLITHAKLRQVVEAAA